MRTGGLLLIGAGAVLVYWVLRAGLKSSASSSGSSSSAGSSSATSSSSASQADSGVRQAIDTTGLQTGTQGQVYTVTSTYGAATAQEQDDMNAYAHAIGNV